LGGRVWGTKSEELNATILEWAAGEGTPEHVNAERDVAVVCLEGSGEVLVDGEAQPLAAGEVTVIPKGTTRRIVAGPAGLRYATVHRRREGLQIAARLRVR
jgi:quercetin dioxygenase-like cupin family protein